LPQSQHPRIVAEKGHQFREHQVLAHPWRAAHAHALERVEQPILVAEACENQRLVVRVGEAAAITAPSSAALLSRRRS